MSIIIKGIDMPKGGNCLTLSITDAGAVLIKTEEGYFEYRENTAVEIPTPHGRLIDGDALDGTIMKINSKEAYITRNDYKLIDNILFEMPTILEAEE